jgi:hypothetical protein
MPGWHFFGAIQGGYAWYACSNELGTCSTTPTYSGPWVRAAGGFRYRLIEAANPEGFRSGGRSRIDVYLSAAAAFDLVAATYDGNQAPQPVIHGVRLGPDAVLGVGFLW